MMVVMTAEAIRGREVVCYEPGASAAGTESSQPRDYDDIAEFKRCQRR